MSADHLELPDHWAAVPLKHFAHLQSGEGITSERIEPSGAYPVFGGNGLRGYTDDYTHDGDYVLIGRQGALCGNINVASGMFWASEHAVVVKPRDCVAPVGWLSSLLEWMNLGQYSMTAAQPGLAVDTIRRLPIPLPPPGERLAIASFLDREIGQIDAMVAAQERLVALLQERRIAVISACVTRGMSGHPTRNSGVQWIGEIPSHWLVQRLKNSIESAVSGTWGEEPVDGDEQAVPCVRVADFDRPRLRVGDVVPTLRAVDDKEYSAKGLRRGDLLLEKSGGGEKNPVGFVVLYDSDTPAVCSNFVGRLRLRDGMDPRYWTYAHAASYAIGLTQRSLKQSTGIQNLDQASYFNEPFPFPPPEEQRQIANHLDGVTSRVDAMIRRAQESIALMKERRAAVISAAVTGRIDVRTGVEQVARELEDATA